MTTIWNPTPPPAIDFDYDKTVDVTVTNSVEFNTDVTYEASYDIFSCINVDPNIDGNSSFLSIDAEAVGYDTFVNVDASVLSLENTLSSVSVTASAIVD